MTPLSEFHHRSQMENVFLQTRKKIAQELHVSSQITPQQEIEDRVRFLVEYVLSLKGCKGFLIAVSGGQDSTLAGRLCQLAAERLRAKGFAECKCVAVRLPHGVQSDEADAQEALRFIQPDHTLTVNIQSSTATVTETTQSALAESSLQASPLTDFNRGNIKARLRMVIQYAIAAEEHLLVIGTDHAAEAVTGFFTKFGDGAADIVPLAGLTKSQGAQLLQELGSPEKLWKKTPTADLLDDYPLRSDEDELGISYQEIDAFLTGEEISSESCEKIFSHYCRTRHKRSLPISPFDFFSAKQHRDENLKQMNSLCQEVEE